MIRSAVAVVAALALGACSTSYLPQSRGRVSVVMQGGQQAYVRDGVTITNGMLGGGLVRAVSGNPRAESAAREYHGRLRDGLLVSLGGLACSVVALSLALHKVDTNDSSHDAVPTELWVSLGCMVVSFGGLGYLATAEPYRWDAINMFNDGAGMPPAPYPIGPPGARPYATGGGGVTTLRMGDDALTAPAAAPAH